MVKAIIHHWHMRRIRARYGIRHYRSLKQLHKAEDRIARGHQPDYLSSLLRRIKHQRRITL